MKKFKEFLNEEHDEGKGVDPKKFLSEEQIEWCNRFIGPHWNVNERGEVEVEEDIFFKDKIDIREFPVQFANIKGYFDCSNCKNLTSLKGAPRKVRNYFNCDDCQGLTSLEGAPEEVESGYFSCKNCINLKTIEGAPRKTGGGFYCSASSYLTSLKGAPGEVGWTFHVNQLPNLLSLEGLPKKFISLSIRSCPKLPRAEQEFTDDEDLQEEWKKSSLDWQKFIYGGAARGRKFGL